MYIKHIKIEKPARGRASKRGGGRQRQSEKCRKKIILKHRETDLNSALPSAHYREGKVRARKRDI